ncbi:DUF1353 domain-containing protein [Caulobacter vibrioides]|uniref:DUF1353 domain-containing protein n=1 Tax=Caulobacter phage S2B TaxID=2759120 RepID=A0AAE7ML23_9CAUD|nr:protein of unknown function DUF1353 [Caulobacter phage S2B]QXZ50199.1 DUF1353 domain-containing protein [Caulobacter vibrioides]
MEVLSKDRDGRGLGRLVQPFSYDVGFLGSGDTVTAPSDYVTDFGSIPWFARWLISPFDRAAKAYVIHDILCDDRSRPRREANRILREALEVLGVPPWKRWTIWLAVRAYALITGRH